MRSFFALVLVGSLVSAQSMSAAEIKPYSRSSADGTWTIAVTPSHSDGSGSAQYAVKHESKPAWSGTKPWAFWDALITDDGFVAGYSYSQGGLGDWARGDFHAVVLAADGTVKLDEVHSRTSSPSIHAAPNPICLGIVHQSESDRVVFRIADPDPFRRGEEWWCFQLPDMHEVYRRRPADVAVLLSDFVVGVADIAGTPLLALQLRATDWPRIAYRCVVVDEELEPVWASGVLDEFDQGSTAEREDFGRRGAHLDSVPGVGEFLYRHAQTGNSIRYLVQRNTGAWNVHGIKVSKQSTADRNAAKRAAFEDMPITTLQLRASSTLQRPEVEAAVVRDIEAFEVTDADFLRFVRRRAEGEFDLMWVDATGRALLERRVALPEANHDVAIAWWPLSEDRWLATQSPSDPGALASAWRVDERSGKVERFAGLDVQRIECVAGFGDGGFAVLTGDAKNPALGRKVIAFGAKGQRQWELVADPASTDPSSLSRPVDIAVTGWDRLAVVDEVDRRIRVFRRDGRPDREFEVERALRIRGDVDGGLLAVGNASDPTLRRISKNGRVRVEFSPRFADKPVSAEFAANARATPGGRIWTHDDQRIVRLDEAGVVDFVVGAGIDAEVLREPCAAAFDVHGRALVQDRETGAVHVFDASGKQLFVCRLDSSDFGNPTPLAHLAATRELGVVVHADSGSYIRFAADGTRLGRVENESGERSLVFSPRTDAAYVGKLHAGFLRLDPEGRVVATFDRAADGSALGDGDEPVIGPDGDGAVAVITGNDSIELFATADPQKATNIELPDGAPHCRMSLGRSWIALTDYGDEALLIERAGERRLRLRLPAEGSRVGSWSFGFDPESDELLALDVASRRILRFALP